MSLAKSRDGRIAATVRKKAAAGVPITEIFASVQGWQNAPASMTTFYKHYRNDIESARGEVTEELGSKVIEQAKKGDYKSQELWLTTKGGWSKQSTNTNVDVEITDEGNGALDSLLQKLGLGDKDDG